MKRILMITILGVSLLLSGCKATLSETALQTAVSEAIMTSSSETAGEVEDVQDTIVEESASQAELNDLKTQLGDAQIQLTAQAAKVAELQAELERVYPLLTPTNTPEPPLVTNTPQPSPTLQPSPTPVPSATNEGGLLFNQKYVVATSGVPIFTYEDENDAGYPIMVKVNPIQKFGAGEKFIVNIHPIRADGGVFYYLVVGPRFGGYYVPVPDVQDDSG